VIGRRPRVGWRLAGALVLAAALVAVLGVLGVRGLGQWLIVSDALAPARAVVLLGGQVPFRAMEAAVIYGEGWAPEIWLTRTRADAADLALLRLGITPRTDENLNQAVLERLKVPAPAVRLLAGDVRNTVDELRLVAAELRSDGGSAVIIVTSKSHTRRVRATWRAVIGGRPAAIVRYASDDPFHADRWWRHTRDALDVSREIFGLLNVWTGFLLRPDGSE
jgi:uncharacterized SAM-binding protein YcdF (DUF218 family)